MRVLHSAPCVASTSGGPAFVVAMTSDMLRRRGHDVEVATTDQLMSTAESEERISGQRVFRSIGGTRVAFSPGHAAWMARNVSRFDIVHIHGYQQPVSLISIAVCVAARIPFVLAPHGTLGEYELSKGSRLKRIAVRVLRALFAVAPAHVTLCTTEAERAELPDWVGSSAVSPIPVEPFEDTITNDRFSSGSGAAPFVLHMGRVAEKKGLVRTARLLAESGFRLDFVVAGDTSSSEAREIRSTVEAVLGDRVRFVGHVTGEAKAELLRSASCLALLSADENFAVAVAESLVEGTPVLVSERVGLSSCVEDLDGGVVVSGDGSGASASDLCRVIEQSDRARLASAARTWFAPHQIAGRLDSVYQELIHAR